MPSFGAEVLVKRRFWGRHDLQPTHERVRYIAPDPEGHGHLVLRPEGNAVVMPYYIGKTKDPELQEVWIALMTEQDHDAEALEKRRRLRTKTSPGARKIYADMDLSLKEAARMDALVQEDLDERDAYQKALRGVLQEEGRVMLRDSTESMNTTFEVMAKIKQMMPALEEDDVLRTRIVGVPELLSEKEKWHDAISGEMRQLFDEKQALVRLSDQDLEDLKKKWGASLVVIPMKAVLTKKPGPRRRFRLVACGNFVEKGAAEDVYTSGADALTVRYALKRAAEERWSGVVVDIKVAFLNAPLVDEDDDPELEAAVVLRPPPLLVKLGYARPGECYRAEKAIYGLRQSPKRWGDHRNRRLFAMRTQSGYVFRPSVAEQNLWRILWVGREDQSEETDEIDSLLYGFLLVYVDDLLILAVKWLAEEVLQTLKGEWATSTPEWLGRTSVRFLGMEIVEHERGFLANQANYIWAKEGVDATLKPATPCPRDMNPDVEDPVLPEKVKDAQKAVGELLWLSTRTRPELSYVIAKCSQMILKAPGWVVSATDHIWQYLKATAREGIWFLRDVGTSTEGLRPAGLEVYSDISYAPHGDVSHGSIFVTWNKSVMWWRSSKQSFPTMSTAESELCEAIEGFMIGDSVDSLVAEHEPPHTRQLLVDNAAAVSLMLDGPTSWRTRHLKIRSSNLRWRISNLDWRINFILGRVQVADIGTKQLSAARLQELKNLMLMGEPPEDLEERNTLQAPEEKDGASNALMSEVVSGVKAALLVALLADQVGRSQAMDENISEKNSEASYDLNYVMTLYTILVMLATVGMQFLVQKAWEKVRPFLDSPVQRGTRDGELMIEVEVETEGEEPARREATPSDDDRGLMDHRERSETPEVSPFFSPASPVLLDDPHGRLPAPFNAFGVGGGDPGPEVPDELEPEAERHVEGDSGDHGEMVVFTTRFGEKYHLDRSCRQLGRAGVVRASRICDICTHGILERQPLYGKKNGTLHMESQHAWADGGYQHGMDILTICSTCWERRERA